MEFVQVKEVEGRQDVFFSSTEFQLRSFFSEVQGKEVWECLGRQDAKGTENLRTLGRCVLCRPERVVEIQEMLAHFEIRLHLGKTQVWNRAGVAPQCVNSLTRSECDSCEAGRCRVEKSLLGVPVRQLEYMRHFLSLKSVEHEWATHRLLGCSC